MDPEAASNVDVRFTVPSTGTYSISGNFLGLGYTSHPVEILDSGTVIFSSTISGDGQSDPFSLSETLTAGTVLDFENLTGSTYVDLPTGLALTISSGATTATAPEPQAYVLIPAGLAFVAFGTRRKWARSSPDSLCKQSY
jgi:hypothetical protein